MKCDEPASRYDLLGEQGKVSSRGRSDPAEPERGKWEVGGDCAGGAPALEPLVGSSACLFRTYSSEHV